MINIPTVVEKVKQLPTAFVGMTEEVWAKTMNADDWRIERLINRLPKRVGSSIRFVRRPSCRWLRIPMGLGLIVGGVLWFLPIAGLWMLPVGLALLADDVRFLRSLRSRALDWVENYRPDWLADGPRS